jgi:hypothetical protein
MEEVLADAPTLNPMAKPSESTPTRIRPSHPSKAGCGRSSMDDQSVTTAATIAARYIVAM